MRGWVQGRDTNTLCFQGAHNLGDRWGRLGSGSLLRKAPGSEEPMRRTGGTRGVTRDKPEAPGGSSGGQLGLIPKEWGGENPLPASGPTVAGMAGMGV